MNSTVAEQSGKGVRKRRGGSWPAPRHFKLTDLLTKFDKCFGATGRNYVKVSGDRTVADIEKRRKHRWNFLFVAGMWKRNTMRG